MKPSLTIVDLYERHARHYDLDRSRSLLERTWLDRFLGFVSPGGTVLDIGCGMGEPIARYIIDNGFRVSGIDSSPSMIDLCRKRFPESDWTIGDMRSLKPSLQFGGVLAWDSFFHLSAIDQRVMFPRFASIAKPGAPLMFTSGPAEGESLGSYHDEALYHASLSPESYLELLTENGFEVEAFEPDDPDCGHHTIWLAIRS